MAFPLRWFVTFVGLTAAWFIVMSVYYSGLGHAQPLDVQFSARAVADALELWSEQDRAYHALGTRTFDLIFPIQLSAVLWLGVSRGFQEQGRVRGFLFVLIALYLLADLIENYTILKLLADNQELLTVKVSATWAKYTCLLPALIAVLVQLGLEIKRSV